MLASLRWFVWVQGGRAVWMIVMLTRGCIVLFFCFNRRVCVCCGCVSVRSVSPLLAVRYVAQAPGTPSSSLGRRQANRSTPFKPLLQRCRSPEQTLLYRRWCIGNSERMSGCRVTRRESFAPVRASPSLSSLSRKAKARSKTSSRLPRLSLATRSPRNGGQLTAWSEMEMGWV